jgi:hydrogenase expression/formation protein HypC
MITTDEYDRREDSMCLAVPLQVTEILGEDRALVKQGSTTLEVSTSLLESVKAGDFVIVHAGFAIELLDLQEAEERLELFRQIEEGA